MRKISPLKGGSVIAVAPASWTEIDRSKIEIMARDFCSKFGSNFIMPTNLLVQNANPYSANSPEGAASSLIDAFRQDDVKAIWAYRGGYGSAKILPILEQHSFCPQDGILIGFSDITALHLYLNQNCHMPSIHGIATTSLLRANNHMQEYIGYLSGQVKTLVWQNIEAVKASENNLISGISAGGNLRVLASLAGSKFALNAKDKIIFLEDVGEKAYSYDRSFYQLAQAGCLAGAKAIVLGDFELPESEKHIFHSMIDLFASYVNVPVFLSKDFGHIDNNRILPLGADTIICQDHGRVEISFGSIFHE